MAKPQRTIPETQDPLAETLHLLRIEGSLYCQTELRAPWGIDIPPIEGCMMLHLVTEGSCLLVADDGATLSLREGTLALVPHGRGHALQSSEDAALTPLFDIEVTKLSERYEMMDFGADGPRTRTLCVVVRLDPIVGDHLLRVLPSIISLDGWEEDAWLQSTLRLVAHEAATQRPGGEAVITRLADVIVIQAIRSWIESRTEESKGWIAALRDPHVGQALAALHRAPEENWTLETLATRACLSRSAFAARFQELVGETPVRYLTGWRMRLAKSWLSSGELSVSQAARRLGYASESSFGRAFKRVCGTAPGSVRG